jgi:methionyl-tRNA formyltransferase
VKTCATALGLEIHQPAKLNDGNFEAYLKDTAPDVGVVAAYGRLLKEPILAIPSMGWLNLHPSLLPRWRGASPIQTAIMAGDTVTGVSIMRLIMEMDAGDVLLQESTEIGEAEDAEALSERLSELGANMMLDALSSVAAGTASFTPQDEELVTHSKIIRKEDGRIRWDASARELHNLVRGAVPWPVAHCHFQGGVFRVLRAETLESDSRDEPGTVTEVLKDRFLVSTGAGQLAVLALQAPGKKAMDTRSFLLGHVLQAGDRFEDIT